MTMIWWCQASIELGQKETDTEEEGGRDENTERAAEGRQGMTEEEGIGMDTGTLGIRIT